MSHLVDEKLSRIKLLLMDVDGVLTDGRIIYFESGETTMAFDVKDGLGIRFLINAGIGVGIITGRESRVVAHRARDLGIEMVYQGTKDKLKALAEIFEKTGVTPDESAFIGDDIPDIPVMEKVGCAFSVKDAHPKCIEAADFVTDAVGGRGAVREICDMILGVRTENPDE